MKIKHLAFSLVLTITSACQAAENTFNKFDYFEFYRAKNSEGITLYIHGSMHTEDPNRNPIVLNDAIYNAKALYTEYCDEIPYTEEVKSILRERSARSDNEPDWLTIFKEYIIEEDQNTKISLYDYINRRFHNMDMLLSNHSAFDIADSMLDILLREVYSSNISYDEKILMTFKAAGKMTTSLESFEETFQCQLEESHFDKEELLVIQNSIDKPEEFAKFFYKLISEFAQKANQEKQGYFKGQTVIDRKQTPPFKMSLVVDRRNEFWFRKAFKDTPTSSLNEALILVGADHLHPITYSYEVVLDDFGKPVGPGLLLMLENNGWEIENLKLDGSWAPWSTLSHLAWVKDEELKEAIIAAFSTN